MRRKILAAMLLASFMTAPAPAQDLRQAIGRWAPSSPVKWSRDASAHTRQREGG